MGGAPCRRRDRSSSHSSTSSHGTAGCKNRLGRAQRLSIRSLGWDGQLTIDGITMIPFNFGVQVKQHTPKK